MHRPQAKQIHAISNRLSQLRHVFGTVAGLAAAAVAREMRQLDEILVRLWRQRNRADAWHARHQRYWRDGLNGKRAVARRLRQIEAGRSGVRPAGVGAILRRENGVVT